MEIAAVGRDDFVQGFKLVGVRRAITSSREEIEKKIAAALDDPGAGMLVLDTPDMKGPSNSLGRPVDAGARAGGDAVGPAGGEDPRAKGERPGRGGRRQGR